LTEKDIALVLAKAHLDTLLTDYVVVGLNENGQIEDFFNCQSKEVLNNLYNLFLDKTEDKIF
jgi:hypothetical protein